jgi:hypothetical protein
MTALTKRCGTVRPGADSFLDTQGRAEVAGRELREGLDSAYACVPFPALHHVPDRRPHGGRGEPRRDESGRGAHGVRGRAHGRVAYVGLSVALVGLACLHGAVVQVSADPYGVHSPDAAAPPQRAVVRIADLRVPLGLRDRPP